MKRKNLLSLCLGCALAGIAVNIIDIEKFPPSFALAESLASSNSESKESFLEKYETPITVILSVSGLLAFTAKIVNSLNAVEYKINEKLVFIKDSLSQDILSKHEGIAKELVIIKQELKSTQSQFQLALLEAHQETLKINHKFETAMVVSDSDYEKLESGYINLQKEVQNILRHFDYRLSELEAFEAKTHDFKPRVAHFNLDIEGL